MMRVALAVILAAVTSIAGADAQDFEGEARWRGEVCPA